MTVNSRSEYINYRLQRAEESYNDALLLAENESWNAVVNRLYYACFYAVIALLLKNDIETQTHDGSRTQFGLQYVKTGLIEKRFGKIYSKLFDMRQKGDYGDLYDFDKETVAPLLKSTREFIDELKKHVLVVLDDSIDSYEKKMELMKRAKDDPLFQADIENMGNG